MPRDYQLYIEDIIQSCQKIRKYTLNMSRTEFSENDIVFDAVLRNLLVIGEASKNLPDSVKNKYNQIEWKKISGLRDIIAHAYFGIDNSILWDVVSNKIPELLQQFQNNK